MAYPNDARILSLGRNKNTVILWRTARVGRGGLALYFLVKRSTGALLIRGDLFNRETGRFCSLVDDVLGPGIPEPAQRHLAGPGMEQQLPAEIASES